MGIWIAAVRAAAVVNLLLLGGIIAVWGRSYLAYRSKYALALLVVAGFFVAENLLAVSMYWVSPTLSERFAGAYTPATVVIGMAGVNLLETMGLAALAWSTWNYWE